MVISEESPISPTSETLLITDAIESATEVNQEVVATSTSNEMQAPNVPPKNG